MPRPSEPKSPCYGIRRNGRTASTCPTGGRPFATPPTGAYVSGPRVTRVVEHGGAAASALHDENRLSTVLAPRGVAPCVAEWTMPRKRHYVFRIAISGIKSLSAKIRYTGLPRRASRPSETLS